MELETLTLAYLGTPSQQAQGLRGDGRAFGCHPSDSLLKIQDGEYEHANRTSSSWTDIALQS